MRRCFLLLTFVLLVCLAQTTEARKLALLVGVDDYESVQSLKCCVNDMKTLKEALMKIDFEENDIQMLVTGGAFRNLPTKKKIEQKLSELLASANSSDLVLIAFSGHGAQNGNGVFFCPPDVDMGDLEGTGVSITKVMNVVANCKAKFKWVVVDACRNDPASSRDAKGLQVVPAPPSGIALFQSCAEGEKSYEEPNGGNGYFTKNFAAALSGEADSDHDGNLTLMEVCKWTTAHTKSDVLKAENEIQTPFFSGSVTDFTISEKTIINCDDIVMNPPLTWSINSIQVVWSIDPDLPPMKRYLCGTDPAYKRTEPKYSTMFHVVLLDWYINIGAEDKSVVKRPNPLTRFGLFGSKVSSCFYLEGEFDYSQNKNYNALQWSNPEKIYVNQVLKSAFEEYCSDQRLIITIDFVNHSKTRLNFSSNSANIIPVYCGNVQIGKARLMDEGGSIAATGKPIPFQFEMTLNERGKQILANNRPVIRLEDSPLNIRSLSTSQDRIEDAIQKSTADTNYFTVAILAGNDVKEWKIRWMKNNPITLQKALEAINEKVCEQNNNNTPVFDIKGGRLASVCGVLFTDDGSSDWSAELKVFKGTGFQKITSPDSRLLETPGRGERYVFQLVSQEIKNLQKKGKAGDAEAALELSKRYDNGDGAPEDKVRALALLQHAAESGNADAQSHLSNCYYYGNGVPENKAESVKWRRKAALQGHARAQCDLGRLYANGEGVQKDRTEAIKWFRKAAEQGNARAQVNLGMCYEYGKGVPKDMTEAVKWYRKAAEQGFPFAQYKLAECYYWGAGVSEDKTEADKWFCKAVNWYRNAANLGNTVAFCQLGVCYSYGFGVSEDKAEAVKWFRKAAEQGDADAQRNLGICYANGEGVPKDITEAVKWFRKAAEQGDTDAQCNLGACYNNGEGVPKDMTEAVKWFRKSAEQGNTIAQCNLGVCYANGEGVPKDMTEAVKWFRKAAEQGFADAQFYLGACYNNGEGVPKDMTEAVRWYRKAAEQGNVNAQYNLGVCYFRGEAVPKDMTEAIKWFRKAAEQGFADAQFYLGSCYKNGVGVPKDMTEAVKWCRKAAEQGNARAQCSLGACYANGEGVQKDRTEAIKWFRKAAEQGNANAQYNLGVCYFRGEGVPKDMTEAIRWYRKAAEQGNHSGQFVLGDCYEHGNGVPKDMTEAVKWYRKAAQQGVQEAIDALKRLNESVE